MMPRGSPRQKVTDERRREKLRDLAARQVKLDYERDQLRLKVNAEVRKLKAEGISISEIAELLSLSRQGVYWILDGDNHGKTDSAGF